MKSLHIGGYGVRYTVTGETERPPPNPDELGEVDVIDYAALWQGGFDCRSLPCRHTPSMIGGFGTDVTCNMPPVKLYSHYVSRTVCCQAISTFFRADLMEKQGGHSYTNYEDKYAEDPPGLECSPNARVWGVYNDEAKVLDAAMVGNLRENADVLLVFAGLFSAVLTTFVTQTSQSLQRDYNPITASLTFEMVQLQRAMLNGSNGASVPSSSWTPDSSFSPATSDVWVNGLWFASLALSLVTSLIAVLSKQWLSHYTSRPPFPNTPLDEVRARQFYYMNFLEWQVPMIISLLPFLLHVALFMFLAGLVVHLSVVVHSLAYTVAAIAGFALVAYSASVLVPVVYPSCPYHTALSGVIFKYTRRLLSFGNNITDLREIQQHVIASKQAKLDSEALLWLLHASSSLSVRSIALQALGCVSTPVAEHLSDSLLSVPDLWMSQQALIKDTLEVASHEDPPIMQPKQGAEAKFRRLFQAKQRFASRLENKMTNFIVPRNWYEQRSEHWYELRAGATEISDMALLCLAGTPAQAPALWPEFPKVMLRVMRVGELPSHTWRDLFEKVDIPAMCRIGGTDDHTPICEEFVAVYLSTLLVPTPVDADVNHRPATSHSMPQNEWEDRLFPFSDIIHDFESQFETALLSCLPRAPDTLSSQLRVVYGVLEHSRMHWQSESVKSSHVLGPSCKACTDLFMAALMRVFLTTKLDNLVGRGMQTFKAMMNDIINSSKLFPEPSSLDGNTAESAVDTWRLRSRVLQIYDEMACSKWMRRLSSTTNSGYYWPTTEVSIRTIIAVTLSGHDRMMLHDTSRTSVDSYPRNQCLFRLHCLLLVHWQTISPLQPQRDWAYVQSTYEKFLQFDVFGLMDQSIHHFPTWIFAVYAYVNGLAHLVGTPAAKEPYINYLHRNLYPVLLVVTGGFSRNAPSDNIVRRLLFDVVDLCRDIGHETWESVLKQLTKFAEFDDRDVDGYYVWDVCCEDQCADFRHNRERVREYSLFIAEYRAGRGTATIPGPPGVQEFLEFYDKGIHPPPVPELPE